MPIETDVMYSGRVNGPNPIHPLVGRSWWPVIKSVLDVCPMFGLKCRVLSIPFRHGLAIRFTRCYMHHTYTNSIQFYYIYFSITAIISIILAGKEQDGEIWTSLFRSLGIAEALHQHQTVGVQNQ